MLILSNEPPVRLEERNHLACAMVPGDVVVICAYVLCSLVFNFCLRS